MLLVVSSGQVWAFPGQTAQELLAALGPTADGPVGPPVPAIEAVRAGTAQLSRMSWPEATYDPLRSGATLKGLLVATFDYRGPDLVARLQKDPPELGWKDLVSRSEFFLAVVPAESFRWFLAGLHRGWTITSEARHGSGTRYEVYSLVSKDGRLQGEMSYSETGALPLSADRIGPTPPGANLWIRVAEGL